MPTDLYHVAVYVSNQDRAVDFYTNKLGFTVRRDVPMGPGMPEMRWIEVAPPGDQMVLALLLPFHSSHVIGGDTRVGLVSDDIATAHAAMSAKGVCFTMPPAPQGPRIQANFVDNDNNEFMFTQFPKQEDSND